MLGAFTPPDLGDLFRRLPVLSNDTTREVLVRDPSKPSRQSGAVAAPARVTAELIARLFRISDEGRRLAGLYSFQAAELDLDSSPAIAAAIRDGGTLSAADAFSLARRRACAAFDQLLLASRWRWATVAFAVFVSLSHDPLLRHLCRLHYKSDLWRPKQQPAAAGAAEAPEAPSVPSALLPKRGTRVEVYWTLDKIW